VGMFCCFSEYKIAPHFLNLKIHLFVPCGV